jgi:FLVCR family feline leukemia virus subgroup C receptor-related protein
MTICECWGLVFRAKPPSPPSQSQINIVETDKPSTLEILKTMVKNKNYLLILLAFGSSNGMYSSFGIMINGVYLNYFPVAILPYGNSFHY